MGAALAKRLGKAGVDVLALDAGTETDACSAEVDALARRGAVAGVYWLPALDDEGPLESSTCWAGGRRCGAG